MLNKLLKYDLKYMIKNMIVFYILSLFFAICTRIFFSLNQTVIINVIGQICVGCMFSMIASIIFNTIIRSFVKFRDSLYKDESYLTHTLPVTKIELYESRFLELIVFLVIGFVISILSLFIAYYTPERISFLKSTINSLSDGLNVNVYFIIFGIITIFFLEIINITQCGFFGIIKGHKKNNSKLPFSFLFGFISYILSQLLAILFMFIIGLFNSEIMNIFISSKINNGIIVKLLIIGNIIYLIINLIINILCNHELKKGVDVE